ncbi:hypothetical protein BV360_00168 [Pseudomonas syringae pv. actinidiae]|nr:hypothetical protein BV339_01585 [Pseudomonas syringae pv. actinidiae]OSN23106.1 hypothetical protein BV340_00167 [Pseudomonas syringae pv. actinidiae]OSN29051.1 hypothetical protein BV341_00169 [Pseudomonas syringae pv. actinidiae]OSN39054.1 hypothetical protein BV343_00101 [Pseudomonas syringae pv. actinidiae]OSN40873.1 hypothetical protein BV342_00166 [Pseudomonas syringae pv. actinidiae]
MPYAQLLAQNALDVPFNDDGADMEPDEVGPETEPGFCLL